MKRTPGWTILILLIILIAICAAAIAAGWMFIPGARQKMSAPFSLPPSVEMIKPQDGFSLVSGQGLVVGASASAPAGLAYAELIADGKSSGRYTPPQTGMESDVPVFAWFSSGAGKHTLAVRAVDSLGREGFSAQVIVNVTPAASLAGGGQLQPAAAGGGSGAGTQGGGVVPGGNNPAGGSEPSGGSALPGDNNPPADNNPPGGNDQPEDNNPPADNNPPGGNDQPEDNNPPADNNPPGGNGPQAQDAPPSIVSLDLQPFLGDGVILLHSSAAAVDDRGLDKLYIIYLARDLNGERGTMTTVCNGALRCQAAYDINHGPGLYTYFAVALDTAGQFSAPASKVFQVLGIDDEPPAAAVDEGGEFELPDFSIGDPGILQGLDDVFNLDDILAAWAAANVAEGLPGSSAAGCLRMDVEPQADGSHITLTALCDLRAREEGSFLCPIAYRTVANSGMGPAEVRPPGWHDPSIRSMAAGTSVSWVDPNGSCGAEYRYQGGIVEYRELANGSTSRLLAGPLYVNVAAPVCPAGGLGDVVMRAEFLNGAMHAAWVIPPGVRWPEPLQADAVHFRLIRYDTATLANEVVDRRAIPVADLQPGGRYSVVDAGTRCGGRYTYTLVASTSETMGVYEGWSFLHTQVTAETNPCGNFAGLMLSANPRWQDDSHLLVSLNLNIPPGLEYPQGQNVFMDILRTRGEDNFSGDAQWVPVATIPIDDTIRRNGLVFNDADRGIQFNVRSYLYRLSLRVDRLEVATWPALTVNMPPGPPPAPVIRSLSATDNCPADAPHCVVIEWDPYAQPPEGSNIAQAERILVTRTIGILDQREFPVNTDATRYVDLQPYTRDMQMADGSTRRVCMFDTQYSLVAVDADGHRYGTDSLSILTPRCDEAWNVVERAR